MLAVALFSMLLPCTFSHRAMYKDSSTTAIYTLSLHDALPIFPTAYDVYPLDGRHDGGYYTVKDCVTIDGIITTIMATIQIGRAVQQECRDRSRMPSSA